MTLRLIKGGTSPREMDAAAWAARLDRGDLDRFENDAFEAWLDIPGNPEAYAGAAAALGAFDGVDPDHPEIVSLRAEALRAADAAARQPPRRWLGWGSGALAASIAAALLYFGLPTQIDPQQEAREQLAASPTTGPVAAGRAAYHTAIGEQRTLILADGSRVTLNTDSEIAVIFGARERVVRLVRGQALFDVAHARERPFIVIAAGRKVTALGTVFEVRFDRDRLEVTLMRGKVRVDEADRDRDRSPTPLAILAPGQQFVAAGALAPVVERVDVEKQLLWRRSLVEFDDETVGRAVAELNRYSQTRIVIADDRVAAMRMSGIVRTGDAAEFTALVGAMLPIASRTNAAGDIELVYAP